jgi:hypothetical protein
MPNAKAPLIALRRVCVCAILNTPTPFISPRVTASKLPHHDDVLGHDGPQMNAKFTPPSATKKLLANPARLR